MPSSSTVLENNTNQERSPSNQNSYTIASPRFHNQPNVVKNCSNSTTLFPQSRDNSTNGMCDQPTTLTAIALRSSILPPSPIHHLLKRSNCNENRDRISKPRQLLQRHRRSPPAPKSIPITHSTSLPSIQLQ